MRHKKPPFKYELGDKVQYEGHVGYITNRWFDSVENRYILEFKGRSKKRGIPLMVRETSITPIDQ